MSLGERIKSLRINKGLTQSELGEILGVSKANISKYESDIHEPRIDSLKKMSSLFDVSIDYILGLTCIEKKLNVIKLGENIKKLRKEKNMTQTELAELLNLTKSNISKYENNIVDPTIDTLKSLSDIFDVSVDYLLGRTNVKKHSDSFAAHTDDDMGGEAKAELENFKDYLRSKYGK